MKYFLPILFVITLSGCGIAKFHDETYETENNLIHNSNGYNVWLNVNATSSTTHIFPVYFSSKRTSPYSISLIAISKSGEIESIFINQVSIKLPDGTLIIPSLSKNKTLFSTQEKSTKDTNATLSVPLNNLLIFHQDKDIEVCVSFLLVEQEIEACKIYKGKKFEEMMYNLELYLYMT